MAPHDQNKEVSTQYPVPQSFSQFLDLPPELRLMIWHYARPRRVVKFTRSISPRGPLADPDRRGIRVEKLLGVPAVAQSCREARSALFPRPPDLTQTLDLPRTRNLPRRPDFHRVVIQPDRQPWVYTLPLTEAAAAAAPPEASRRSWFDGSRDLLVWTVQVPVWYEWRDEARRLLCAPAARRLLLLMWWVPMGAVRYGSDAMRKALVCELATIFARLDAVSFLLTQMDIDLAALGVVAPRARAPQSCVLVDIHDDAHVEKADRLFARLAQHPEAAYYVDQWNRFGERGTPLEAGEQGYQSLVRALAPESHKKTWGRLKELFAHTWREMKQDGDPAGLVPEFQEVIMIKTDGSFLRDAGFGDDIYEC
ncbi:hypothetical protein F4775DRAFT_553895 [Biscogniauxia sp. FL1348]|nr:hypothetical protein F4775DRAFT_553895 [Biscogniauxia sp. FL1348]